VKPQPWLWPLSIPYRVAVGVRNRLFDIGVRSIDSVDAPVLSVGNIAAGGTGKSPFVIYLVERLQKLYPSYRRAVAVVSRGYRSGSRQTLIVSDGKRMLSDPFKAGDEPVMIAEALNNVAVVVDRNRVRGAGFAVDNLKAKIIVLDDGFQHRRLKRDLDIVLLNSRNPLGSGLLLPAGFLREPASALKRADLVVLSKVEIADDIEERCCKLSALLGKPVCATQWQPRYWRRVGRSEPLSADQIRDRRVTAFAGIANPQTFFETVERLGGEIAAEIPLPDHCNYSKFYLDKIASTFTRSRSEWMATTAKDAVKLPPILRMLPVYYLDAKLEVIAGLNELDAEIKKAVGKSLEK